MKKLRQILEGSEREPRQKRPRYHFFRGTKPGESPYHLYAVGKENTHYIDRFSSRQDAIDVYHDMASLDEPKYSNWPKDSIPIIKHHRQQKAWVVTGEDWSEEVPYKKHKSPLVRYRE